MTRKIVPFLLILLLAAGLAHLLRPAPTPQGLEVAPVEPSRIEHIRVTGDAIPDGSATRESPGVWTITLEAGAASWPASTPAVRSALRALAEIASLEPGPPAEFIPATSLTLSDDAGAERRFDFAPAVIGGRRAVTIDARATVTAPARLSGAITDAGPAAWRDPLAFPGVDANVTRLLITQAATDDEPPRSVEIRRAAGRWLITAPVTARASEKAVDAAIARIAAAEIERFVDEPLEPELTALDTPVFTITVVNESETRSVRFGAQSGASGLERFAAAADSDAVFVVDTALLRELRLDPAAYTDRRVTPTPAADVAAIVVSHEGAEDDLRAERTLEGWSASSERFEPAALLELLTSAAGVTVEFEPPTGWTPLATVRLEDLAGDPLDVIVIGVAADGQLRAASRLPGADPVYYSVPGLTPESLGLSSQRPTP